MFVCLFVKQKRTHTRTYTRMHGLWGQHASTCYSESLQPKPRCTYLVFTIALVLVRKIIEAGAAGELAHATAPARFSLNAP